MWDEFVIGGDVQETSKKNVLKAISDQDMIQEVCHLIIQTFNLLHYKFNSKRFLIKAKAPIIKYFICIF